MNLSTFQTWLRTAQCAAVFTLTLAAVLYAAPADNPAPRLLILPFVPLETGEASQLMTSDLFHIFVDTFSGKPGIEVLGDHAHPMTTKSYSDEDMQAEGTNTGVDWVLAGELQGGPHNWELFLRIMDPKDGITRPSSIKGINTYQMVESVDDWIQRNMVFLTTTDSTVRAQKEGEINQESAVNYYKQARRLTGDDPKTLNQKIDLLQKAIDLMPGFVSAYLSLGYAYQQLRNYDAALDAYQTAIQIKPTYDKAYYDMGTVYQDLSKWAEAAKAYTKAIELNPKYREAWFNLAWVMKYNANNQEYGEGFDVDSVEHCLRKIIEFDPSWLKAYVGLGNLYMHTDELEKAKSTLEEAIRRDDRFEEGWYTLSILYDNYIHDYPAAIDCYERYIELGGHRAPGARNRIAYLQQQIALQDSLSKLNSQPQTAP